MSVNYNPATPTDGLVLCIDPSNPRCYPGSGTTVFDLSGNNNNGTLTNGASVINTRGGKVLDFDGVNDEILINLNLNFLPIVHFTGWIFTTRASNNFGVMGNDNGSYGRVIRSVGNNIDILNSTFTSGLSGLIAVPLNGWFHLAVLWSTFSMTMHINGILRATTSGEAGVYNDATTTTLGGTGPGGAGQRLLGMLDDCRIYNRALTEPEIRQLFESKRGRFL